MRGNYKKHDMCCVDVSVMIMVTNLLSVSTMVEDRETTQKCGIFNLNTLGSTSDIQIKESFMVSLSLFHKPFSPA